MKFQIWVIRLGLFLLPAIVLCLGMVALAWGVGEARPFPIIIEQQMQDELVAVYTKTRDEAYRFRAEALRIRQPEFVVFGSSTSLRLRPIMVEDPSLFLNVGMAGGTPNEVLALLQSLPDDYSPKVMILVLDIWRVRFLPERDTSDWFAPYSDWRSVQWAIDRIHHGTVELIQSLVTGRYDLRQVTMPDTLHPELHTVGIPEADKQINRGNIIFAVTESTSISNTAADEHRRTQIYRNLLGLPNEFGSIQFADDTQYRPYTDLWLEDIRAILEFAQERGIRVVGYTSPIAPIIYSQIDGHPCYQNFAMALEELTSVFQQYAMPFIALHAPTLSELHDAHFIDAYHYSDLGTFQVFRNILQAFPEVLAPYSNEEHIDALIAGVNRLPAEEEAAYVAAERDRLLALGTIPTNVCPSQVES